MQPLGKNYFYFDIPKEERNAAISFLLEALVKSRESSGLHRDAPQCDEDVNIYLAHLLFAVALPDYQEAVRRYVSMNISDIQEMVEHSEDKIVQYFIYKVNADNLLVHLGIFDDLRIQRNRFGKSEEQFLNMAKTYYERASEYNRRIYHRQTAIGSVLHKLSSHFDEYQKILHCVRRDYFHFSNEFTDRSFHKFCDDMKQYEQGVEIKEQRDLFLDLYAEWIRTKDPGIKIKLNACAKHLEKIDPEFRFQ